MEYDDGRSSSSKCRFMFKSIPWVGCFVGSLEVVSFVSRHLLSVFQNEQAGLRKPTSAHISIYIYIYYKSFSSFQRFPFHTYI